MRLGGKECRWWGEWETKERCNCKAKFECLRGTEVVGGGRGERDALCRRREGKQKAGEGRRVKGKERVNAYGQERKWDLAQGT